MFPKKSGKKDRRKRAIEKGRTILEIYKEISIQIEGYTKKKFRFHNKKKESRFFWQKNEEMGCILFRDGIQ